MWHRDYFCKRCGGTLRRPRVPAFNWKEMLGIAVGAVLFIADYVTSWNIPIGIGWLYLVLCVFWFGFLGPLQRRFYCPTCRVEIEASEATQSGNGNAV